MQTGLDGLWGLLEDAFRRGLGLVLVEPPAGFGAECGGGGASDGAWIGQGAEGEVHLTEEAKVLPTAGWRGGADHLGRGNAGLAEPLPQGAGLAAARPGVGVEAEELDALRVPQGLAGQLGQGVVEEEEHGQAAEVAERAAVHLPDAVVMEEKAVQVDQTTKHVLWEGSDAVAMQEQLAQVDEVRKDVILEEVEVIFLKEKRKRKVYY